MSRVAAIGVFKDVTRVVATDLSSAALFAMASAVLQVDGLLATVDPSLLEF